jgi:hypothetical protein
MKTALIIDDDLGFVFWLGHALDSLAYSALPAKSIPDAALLVMQLDLTVQVVVVNPALPGSADFIAALRRSQRGVRVVGILKTSSLVPHIQGVNATHQKPTIFDDSAKTGWIDCIENVLAQAAYTA